MGNLKIPKQVTNMFQRVNRGLLPMKGHYFLFNAGTGPVVPFLSVYARQLGFSSVIVGLIYTVLPICGMIAKPIAGAIADRFKCQKVIFLGGQLMTAIAFLAIYYSPNVPLEKTVHFSYDRCNAVFDTSPKNTTIDECVVADLQKAEGSITCNLDCSMEDAYWTVVINHWNMTDFQNSHPDRLKFSAHVPIGKVLNDEYFVTFPLENITVGKTVYRPSGCNHCTNKECYISTLCKIDCDDFRVNDLVEKPALDDSDVYSRPQFWILFLLMIIGWVSQAVVVSVGDTICFEMLGDKPNRYGQQRLFGALGWGVSSALTGVMVDALSKGSSKIDYLSAFYLAVAFLLLDFIVSSRLQYVQKKMSTSILRDVGRLLVDIRIIVFLIWCMFVGMCTALIWNFLFWLIEDLAKEQGCDSQGWIKTLEGLVMAVETLLGEMPFFFLSGSILKRIGHTHSMTLVVLVIGLRYIIYSVIKNPWWFLPVELLNGLTFGLFYACMASYASIVAPAGTETTMQGMVGAVFEGVGVSAGSSLAGVLYNKYGGPLTFRMFGIASLIVCLLHAAAQYLLRKRGRVPPGSNKRRKKDVENEGESFPGPERLRRVS